MAPRCAAFFFRTCTRGKRFEYNLIRKKMSAEGKPDDEIEPLLRVNYRFHWQMSYRLAEPRFLRAETELQAFAWCDNSRRIRTIRMRMQRCLGRADLRRNDGGLFRRGGTGGGRQAALFHPERRTIASSLQRAAPMDRRRAFGAGAAVLFAI